MKIIQPRKGHFDSLLTECGPPAVRTKHGIVLMYNGKNSGKTGDADYPANAYCAGQLLLDGDDPYKVLDRLDKPFLQPTDDFEKSGQYLLRDLHITKGNYTSIMVVLILG